MKFSKRQIEKAQSFFQSIDRERLLHGPDDKEAFFFHGVMEGMRESLELLNVEIDGITGLWWYEELSGKRQMNSVQLIQTLKNETLKTCFIDGHTYGVRKVMGIKNRREK